MPSTTLSLSSSSSQPLLPPPPSSLSLILTLSLPHLSTNPPSLVALSFTSKAVRGVVLGEVFRERRVERTLDEEVGLGLGMGMGMEEVRGAVRRLEWVVKGKEGCNEEDSEEEEEDLEGWERRGREVVEGELGREISSLPHLLSLSLLSSTFHRQSSTPLSLSLSLPSSSLLNLSSLSLTGFSIPTPLLLTLLLSAPNLLSLTLQTFNPPTPSSSSVFPDFLNELTSSSPTPSPSPLPPTLPDSALQHLHTFTGLASHLKTLLPPPSKGQRQRSLRSLNVEMGGFEGGWEELVRDLKEGLPYREGKAGLVELRILGVEMMSGSGGGGVEEGQRMLSLLGEGLRAVGGGGSGLEVLEVGWVEGVGEEGGEVEDLLTKSLPTFQAFFPSLHSLTFTTPEPSPLPPPSPPPPSSSSPTTPPSSTSLPLLPLSLALPSLETLTINSTLWRFFRPLPPPLPSPPSSTTSPSPSLLTSDDPNALSNNNNALFLADSHELVRIPTNTSTTMSTTTAATTRPGLTSSGSASGSMGIGMGGLNNNKKVGRRGNNNNRVMGGCEVQQGAAADGAGVSSEEEEGEGTAEE